jgi:uncharacterized repeat protein (TIGR01451 family)
MLRGLVKTSNCHFLINMGGKKMKKWKKSIRRFKDSNNMVAEIIGTVLLLGIAVAIFSTLYVVVFSYPFPTSSPNVTLIGTIEGSYIIIEHHSGEALSLDTEIMVGEINNMDSFAVGDLLDDESKKDGVWNIGERIVYPFKYNISRTQVEIMTVDTVSNSLILIGTLDIHPECDIGLGHTVDEQFPEVGDTVNFTITTNNYRGDINATGVKIKNTLLDGLTYQGFSTTHGNYNHSTGIWDIGELAVGQSVSLTITANVKQIDTTKSQMAMILDGSGSISSTDWDIMRTGLADAIEDENIFPHDGSVELTVIQFGDYDSFSPHAQVEIPPTIITDTNLANVADDIRSIEQLGGATPLGCGIRLAADQLLYVGSFNPEYRQVINLVTDGISNCEWIPGAYTGTWKDPSIYGYGPGKASAEEARTYLLNELEMTEDQDEFDIEAIGSEPDIAWLLDNIAWPQPGYDNWPPTGPGWVRQISDYIEFADTIDELFENYYLIGGATSTAEIVSSTPMDPNPANNKTCITITPKLSQ